MKLLLEVPTLHWLLMALGFTIHVLMKLVKHINKGNKVSSFFTVTTCISMFASLLMSVSMIMAGTDSFKGNNLLAFGALGAGYLNNSLFANVIQIFNSRVSRKIKEEES